MPEIKLQDRLIAIDIARGIALLGVALVNVHAFAATWASPYGLDMAHSSADVVAEYVVAMLFSHRSYPVLSFLFGAGLGWQWMRHAADSLPRPTFLRPRLWALLIVGLAHGLLLWPGDVLSTYAVLGLIIVSQLKLTPRASVGWAVGLYSLALALYGIIGLSMWMSPRDALPPEAAVASFELATVAEALALHPAEYLLRGLPQVIAPDVWAHALLGMWAARSGALQRFLRAPLAHPALVIAGASAFALGSIMELFAVQYGGWNGMEQHDAGVGIMLIALTFASLGGLWFWLTAAACWGGSRFAHAALATLVIAAGRAPLTQFIGQSIVFAVLFNKSLVGLHGELGRGVYSLMAIATYALLCAFIRAWLASGHRYGPMEIVWRWLTRLFSTQNTS